MHVRWLRRWGGAPLSRLRRAWPRRRCLAATSGRWLRPLVGMALLLLLLLPLPAAAAEDHATAPMSGQFRCDGTPLSASLYSGAVDDPTIPNRSGGTLPGAFVLLRWQRSGEQIVLQLPRTNNAGAPSFSDGKWWWSLEDPGRPRFRLRRGSGDIEDVVCEPA